MSAFLGPIHGLMYQRILNQEEITAQILQLAENNGWCSGLENRANQKFGERDTRPLTDLIDETNIHG